MQYYKPVTGLCAASGDDARASETLSGLQQRIRQRGGEGLQQLRGFLQSREKDAHQGYVFSLGQGRHFLTPGTVPCRACIKNSKNSKNSKR